MTLPKFLTVAEVAEILRVTPDYVRRKCAQGELRAKRLGNEWRIAEDDLALFMTPGRAAPTRVRRRAS